MSVPRARIWTCVGFDSPPKHKPDPSSVAAILTLGPLLESISRSSTVSGYPWISRRAVGDHDLRICWEHPDHCTRAPLIVHDLQRTSPEHWRYLRSRSRVGAKQHLLALKLSEGTARSGWYVKRPKWGWRWRLRALCRIRGPLIQSFLFHTGSHRMPPGKRLSINPV